MLPPFPTSFHNKICKTQNKLPLPALPPSKHRRPASPRTCQSPAFGKTGELNALLNTLGSLPPEEKPLASINECKQRFQAAYDVMPSWLTNCKPSLPPKHSILLPGRAQENGGLHPVTLTLQRVVELFTAWAFEVADGPEIEDDFHNFQAPNIPANHPARAMQDTFYVENGDVLRTHTSPIQIRYMLNKKSRPSALSPQAVSIAWTATRRTRLCSIKLKVCG